jgi:hypothetical protein
MPAGEYLAQKGAANAMGQNVTWDPISYTRPGGPSPWEQAVSMRNLNYQQNPAFAGERAMGRLNPDDMSPEMGFNGSKGWPTQTAGQAMENARNIGQIGYQQGNMANPTGFNPESTIPNWEPNGGHGAWIDSTANNGGGLVQGPGEMAPRSYPNTITNPSTSGPMGQTNPATMYESFPRSQSGLMEVEPAQPVGPNPNMMGNGQNMGEGWNFPNNRTIAGHAQYSQGTGIGTPGWGAKGGAYSTPGQYVSDEVVMGPGAQQIQSPAAFANSMKMPYQPGFSNPGTPEAASNGAFEGPNGFRTGFEGWGTAPNPGEAGISMNHVGASSMGHIPSVSGTPNPGTFGGNTPPMGQYGGTAPQYGTFNGPNTQAPSGGFSANRAAGFSQMQQGFNQPSNLNSLQGNGGQLPSASNGVGQQGYANFYRNPAPQMGRADQAMDLGYQSNGSGIGGQIPADTWRFTTNGQGLYNRAGAAPTGGYSGGGPSYGGGNGVTTGETGLRNGPSTGSVHGPGFGSKGYYQNGEFVHGDLAPGEPHGSVYSFKGVNGWMKVDSNGFDPIDYEFSHIQAPAAGVTTASMMGLDFASEPARQKRREEKQATQIASKGNGGPSMGMPPAGGGGIFGGANQPSQMGVSPSMTFQEWNQKRNAQMGQMAG